MLARIGSAGWWRPSILDPPLNMFWVCGITWSGVYVIVTFKSSGDCLDNKIQFGGLKYIVTWLKLTLLCH